MIDAFGAAGWKVSHQPKAGAPVHAAHAEFEGDLGWGKYLTFENNCNILLSLPPDTVLRIDTAFTIVRSPHHRFRSTCMRHVRSRDVATLDSTAEKIINACKANRHYLDNHIRPQTELLPGQQLAKEIDLKVYRFEDGAHRAEIARMAGHTGEWPRVGSDKYSEHTEVMFSESTIELIYDFYREDYERYGYLRYLL